MHNTLAALCVSVWVCMHTELNALYFTTLDPWICVMWQQRAEPEVPFVDQSSQQQGWVEKRNEGGGRKENDRGWMEGRELRKCCQEGRKRQQNEADASVTWTWWFCRAGGLANQKMALDSFLSECLVGVSLALFSMNSSSNDWLLLSINFTVCHLPALAPTSALTCTTCSLPEQWQLF